MKILPNNYFKNIEISFIENKDNDKGQTYLGVNYPGLSKICTNILRFDRDGNFEYILTEIRYTKKECEIMKMIARYVWIVYQEQKNKSC